MSNIPLSEKYRPVSFDQVMGLKDLDKLKALVSNSSDMPNLLLHGPPGTGKTTTVKILLNELNPIDYIKINGSDETGVDTIRDKVYNFVTSMSTQKDKPKIVWIEEFDYMSHNAFAALRSMIEEYIKNARFVCTANFLSKIPDPIQSRFSCIEYEKLSDDDIYSRLKYINSLETEILTDEDLLKITKLSNGDLRTAVNRLTFKDVKMMTSTLVYNVFDLLKSKDWETLRYVIPQKDPDYKTLLVDLTKKIYTDEGLTIEQKGKICSIISLGMLEMTQSFDPHITFAAICYRIIQVI